MGGAERSRREGPQINRSWRAAPGYREEFPLSERLRDLVAYGVVSDRLTEEEADLIERATVAAEEPVAGMGLERRVNELLNNVREQPAQQCVAESGELAEEARQTDGPSELEAEAC